MGGKVINKVVKESKMKEWKLTLLEVLTAVRIYYIIWIPGQNNLN